MNGTYENNSENNYSEENKSIENDLKIFKNQSNAYFPDLKSRVGIKKFISNKDLCNKKLKRNLTPSNQIINNSNSSESKTLNLGKICPIQYKPNNKLIDTIERRLILSEEEFSKLLSDKTQIIKNMNSDANANTNLYGNGNTDIKISNLQKENVKLREKFKELNDMLTILLDYKKMKTIRNYKAIPPLNKKMKKPRQGSATMNPKNINNLEKSLQNIECEYNYLKERRDKASNPEYLQKITSINSKLSEEIKIMKKKIKLKAAEVKKNETKFVHETKAKQAKQEQLFQNNINHNKNQNLSNGDAEQLIELENKLVQLKSEREKISTLKENLDKLKEERENKILDLTYKYEDYDLTDLSKTKTKAKTKTKTQKIQNEDIELSNLNLTKRKSNLLGKIESSKTKYKLASLEYLSKIKSKEKEIQDEERALKEINESYKDKRTELEHCIEFAKRENSELNKLIINFQKNDY